MLMVGQYKLFWGMEELIFDLFISFFECSLISVVFGFEWWVGVSVVYQGKVLLVQVGVFIDDVQMFVGNDVDNSYSVDGWVVFMFKLGNGQFYFGGLIYYCQFNDFVISVFYVVCLYVCIINLMFVNIGQIVNVMVEWGMGFEVGYFVGCFYVMGEGYWQCVLCIGFVDFIFNGGYVELGYLLIDDVIVYKGGVIDCICFKNLVEDGGIGVIQVNVCYDWLDFNDVGVIGGCQQIVGLGLIWMLIDYVCFLFDYGYVWVKDVLVIVVGDCDYLVDVIGVCVQFDF